MSASLPRWLSSRPPSAALEIGARRVAAAVVSVRRGSRVLTAYAGEPLPDGAVEPALNASNVHDAPALIAAIRAVLDAVTPRPRRVALVLADSVAKVSLLRFEKIPAKVQDLDQLIRWQVRKSAPFRIEDAQLAWIPGVPLPEGGREYIVTVARRDVVESYERAVVAAGAHPGIVDLASLNLVNLVLAGQTANVPSGDWLLVHVAADYTTVAVVRGRDMVFFRTRPSEREESVADLVHQTAMYHEDRLGGGGFARVVLAGVSSRGADSAERLRREIQARVGAPVEPIEFGVGLRDRITAGPELLDSLGPAIGLILREQVA